MQRFPNKCTSFITKTIVVVLNDVGTIVLITSKIAQISTKTKHLELM